MICEIRRFHTCWTVGHGFLGHQCLWNACILLRWHTTYDAFPGAGPIPVALQPPNAVPHLVEFHHQRGDLGVKRTKVLWNVRQQHHNFEKSKLWFVRRPTDENIRMIYDMKVSILAETSQRYWCRCELVDAFLFEVPHYVVWEEVFCIFFKQTLYYMVWRSLVMMAEGQVIFAR